MTAMIYILYAILLLAELNGNTIKTCTVSYNLNTL